MNSEKYTAKILATLQDNNIHDQAIVDAITSKLLPLNTAVNALNKAAGIDEPLIDPSPWK